MIVSKGAVAAAIGFIVVASLSWLPAQTAVGKIQVDSTVKVVAERVPLRQHPPNEGLFYGNKAELRFSAKRGERFKVLEVRTVKKAFRHEIWIHLQRQGDRKKGWAYAGAAGGQSSNFQLET